MTVFASASAFMTVMLYYTAFAVQPHEKGAGRPAPPFAAGRAARSAPALLLALGHDGDADGFAAIAGEAGEHRLDQVRDQPGQLVGAAAGLGMALEERLAVAGGADVHVEEPG